MFDELDLQLEASRRYTFTFVIVCPYTREFMAEYPLYSSLDFDYDIDGFGSGIQNVFQYQPDPSVIEMPKESDLYAPFVRLCYLHGDLSTLPTTSGGNRRLIAVDPTTHLGKSGSVQTGSSLHVEACFGGVEATDAESIRNLLETDVVLGARVELLNARPCKLSTGVDGWTLEFRVFGSHKDSWEELTKRMRLPTRLQSEIFQKLGLFVPLEQYLST